MNGRTKTGKMKKNNTTWTIGHSNQPIETFLDLLAKHQIAVLVDVRSSPYARYASQFDKEAVQYPLHTREIKYLFLGDLLGGRAEGDEFYDSAGHVLYGKVAQSPKFQQGIDRLLEAAAARYLRTRVAAGRALALAVRHRLGPRRGLAWMFAAALPS